MQKYTDYWKRIWPKFFDKTKCLASVIELSSFQRLVPKALNTYVTKGLLSGLVSSSKVDLQLPENWFHEPLRGASSHQLAPGSLWSLLVNVLLHPSHPSTPPTLFFVSGILEGGRYIAGRWGWGDRFELRINVLITSVFDQIPRLSLMRLFTF